MKANYRIVLVLAMLIASLNVFAQQLPFQGKLLENGQPANGSKTFQFSIANGGNNWNEIQTVQVNNGLYAVVLGSVSPLPATLFSQQVALNLVVQVNGNTIDTVQIYPPIEADPTVPSNIKDGVQWSDIQNLPTLDYSPANELQNLALNGSVLSISQGNSVILPPVELPEGMEYSPIDTSIIEDVNQAISTTNLLEDNVWQSFKANHTGKLESVSIYFANSYLSNILLKVYPGVGISGQELFNHTFSGTSFSSSMQIQELSVSDFSTINLVAGNEYTFQLISVGQDVLLAIDGSNNYLDGISSISGNTDLKFKVSLEIIEPFTVVVNGTFTANQFTGNGIVPAGGIIMWSGSISNIPVGWSLCDGSNGTPDLRDRFIVGAGNIYSVAVTGGEATHALTTAEMPAHTHTIAKTSYGQGSEGRIVSGNEGAQLIDSDALNLTGGNQPHENRPPYYALAYIMKLP